MRFQFPSEVRGGLMIAHHFLRVNLSDRAVKVETIPEETCKLLIGGRGFGISYLYQEQSSKVDPFGEENKLLLITGVLGGTAAQSCSRWMACTKSPLTGGFARSVAGADFGAWMRFAGYDFILIEGRSEKPVYVHVTREGCNIHDAGELCGVGIRLKLRIGFTSATGRTLGLLASVLGVKSW